MYVTAMCDFPRSETSSNTTIPVQSSLNDVLIVSKLMIH